jgi:hypothetical protein
MVRKPEPGSGRLTPYVGTFLRTTLYAPLCALALAVGPSATVGAEPQQPADGSPVSLERIKEELGRAPARDFKPEAPVQLRPTFRSRVDQRVFVLTLEEALHKEFDLNELQRQSAEWSSKCCGYNIGQLVEMASEALRARKIRKTREQIWRELAELEAARKKLPPADVK